MESKLILLLSLILFSAVSGKIYDDYASFEGCLPDKRCRLERVQDQIAFFSRSAGSCSASQLDESFLLCRDRSFLCGYLPIQQSANTTIINNSSGVVVANGLNLGSVTQVQLESMGVPSILIERLRPFIGIKGESAYELLLLHNFTLTTSEGELLTSITNKYAYSSIEFKYDFTGGQGKFVDLPIELRTALVSSYKQNGFKFSDSFWSLIANRNWDAIYDALNSEGKSRKMESSMIFPFTSYKNLTQTSSLSVFLIDISHITNKEDFEKLKTFLVDYSQSMAVQTGSLSVILYQVNAYTVIDFSLNSTYTEAIGELDYDNYKSSDSRRWTHKGLEESMNLIEDELIYRNTTRSIDYMNIFFFASGESSESIQEISDSIRNKGINVVSIGLNLQTALNDFKTVSTDSSNILVDSNLTLDNLSCLNKRIKSYDYFNHRLLNKTTYPSQKLNAQTTYYFKANLNPQSNLVIRAKVLDPLDNVNIFVSYLDSFPNVYSYDYFHNGTNSNSTKEIVIQGDTSNLVDNGYIVDSKASFGNDVYIAIRSKDYSRSVKFDLEVAECDVNVCSPGTNEEEHKTNLYWLLVILVIILILFMIVFILYLIRCYRKPKEVTITDEKTSNYHKLVNP